MTNHITTTLLRYEPYNPLVSGGVDWDSLTKAQIVCVLADWDATKLWGPYAVRQFLTKRGIPTRLYELACELSANSHLGNMPADSLAPAIKH